MSGTAVTSQAEPRRVLFLCSGNYYRSRFAELLFNHLAESERLAYRADSAGLWPECYTHNPGPLSPHTIAALGERGVPLPAVLRAPRDVELSDFEQAALTVALKEAEHRPLVMQRFPQALERVEFWHVDDVGDAPPSVALPMIERLVRELIQRLRAPRA
ncbi:MAG TPA: low molecular weight phosphatase family protein [Polyangiaceae bacterium]|nr:low molecular weight phosphatase family protein [Polyangiaceae bacterium]